MSTITSIGILLIMAWVIWSLLSWAAGVTGRVAMFALKAGICLIVLACAMWVYNHTVVYFI
jgi:hypothetical protein